MTDATTLPLPPLGPSGWMGDPSRGASMGRANFERDSLLKYACEDYASARNAVRYFEDFKARGEVPSHLDSMEAVETLLATRRAEVERYRGDIQRLSRAPEAPTLNLVRVPTDEGYDAGGAYWGHNRLWWAGDAFGAFSYWIEAGNRAEAMAEALELCPAASFYAG